MTNTESLRLFDKVAALVAVENVGIYSGPFTAAVNAGIDEGYLVRWPANADGIRRVSLSDTGYDRLAGFRALLAPAD